MVNTARSSANFTQDSSWEIQKKWYYTFDGELTTEPISRKGKRNLSVNREIKSWDKLYLDNTTWKISNTPSSTSQLIENFEEVAEMLAEKQQEQQQEELQKQKSQQKETQNLQVDELKKLLEEPDKFAVGNKIEYTDSKGNIIEWEIIQPITWTAEWSISIKTSKQQNGFAKRIDLLEADKNFKVTKFATNSDEINLNKETVQQIIEARESLESKNSSVLEELKNAKRKWNQEGIKNLYQIIKRLIGEENELKNKYENVKKYDNKQLNTLDTKWIRWRWPSSRLKRDDEGREIILKIPNIKIVRDRRSRRKLNKLVKYFNHVKNDSDKAMKYILTQARGNRIDTVTWANSLIQWINRWTYNLFHSTGFVMSKSKFEEMFTFKKQELLYQFSNNIKNLTTDEKNIIKAIEQRMDYYKDAYMREHYGVGVQENTHQPKEWKVFTMNNTDKLAA